MRAAGHIGQDEMRSLLREAYSEGAETLLAQIARGLCDPAMPRDADYRPRAHPLWLPIGLIALSILGVFLYFSLLGPSR
jgi:hypothetical protein